ncbi:MFS transporter [Jannaschia pagri]|uniref:MFS transporter n=1 Tax=Jannaschia pagri TaxID=2829797 RepID=A0ABQ4NQ02_9RHOB|nr:MULTISPECIES: MFS transporter [unclassified Jannaschia]GIT92665.1 MFS transporter [Jannaschia sp. AI_61]GIT96475.1 MFS transporter [Jannaschia sp. AI_62]
MTRNIQLYPWFRFLRSLIFWQAVWFLYLQAELSAAEAIAIYAIYDVATTLLEVPSGWLSDRWGRRPTLIVSAAAALATAAMQATGGPFLWFAAAQILLGVHAAFASGTDSSLLYQSLAADGRADDMDHQEMIGWRAGFAGLALSAVVGGALARWDLTWPYIATTLAYGALLLVTLAFQEPPRDRTQQHRVGTLRSLGETFRLPMAVWLLLIGVLMYGFSHVSFVFGQPVIESALAGTALARETPLVSGIVTASMMSLSLVVSIFAPGLRTSVGLVALLLCAFAFQIALPGALAIATGPVAILLLLGRMIPDALAQPFLVARLQALLRDESRATFLSLQSLLGRVLFAATLWIAATSTTDVGQMPDGDLRMILAAYAMGGVVLLIGLTVFAWRLPKD